MSALDVLRQIKQARRGETAVKVVEWGNADYINEIGIENMSRRDLRNHLEARDLDTQGTRLELIERLRGSIADEQLHKFAYVETIDTEFLIQADLEERGSVYVCGSNNKGELGVGDMNIRPFFVVIPQLRGMGVNFIKAGVDMCYAVTEECDVYVWGGGGVGRTGINPQTEVKTIHVKQNNWLEPLIVTDLAGEEIYNTSIGSAHCLGVGKGGDCFVWGDNNAGQLGLGDFSVHQAIAINNSFPAVDFVEAGANHSCVITRNGQVYTWGHSANGRLGIGASERIGALEREKYFFPVPQWIKTLEPVKQVSCGTDHSIAYGPSGVWVWGSGSSGKLGLGDTKDRYDPVLVPKLRGKFVLQVVASMWHSMALVGYPPLVGGGWIYTFGSGYHGQLAQGPKCISNLPEVVDYFRLHHIVIKQIAAGSHHCAAITKEGELYTWGSNNNGALGRRIDERDVNYTPKPGVVGGFGAIVNRIGRGFPRVVTCGKEFTIVSTFPYIGPNLAVATKLMEEAKIREQEANLTQKVSQNFNEESMG